ncbi:MAG: hypothetical protein Q8J60_07295, partial [Thiobacillus sp.]|nr:hypothetical protein [Thiobacillus sp.]
MHQTPDKKKQMEKVCSRQVRLSIQDFFAGYKYKLFCLIRRGVGRRTIDPPSRRHRPRVKRQMLA